MGNLKKEKKPKVISGSGQTIVLTITARRSSQGLMSVDVMGPMQDTVLCYGLLEIARDIVKKQGEATTKTGSPLFLAKGGVPHLQ